MNRYKHKGICLLAIFVFAFALSFTLSEQATASEDSCCEYQPSPTLCPEIWAAGHWIDNGGGYYICWCNESRYDSAGDADCDHDCEQPCSVLP